MRFTFLGIGLADARKLSTTVLVAICSATAVGAQSTQGIGTSSTGSGAYNWGAILAKVVNENQDAYTYSSQATAGFGENLVLVANGRLPFGLNTTSTSIEAFNGVRSFEPYAEKFGNLRWVTGIAMSTWHCMTPANSGIKSLSDIEGRNFNLNRRSTSTRGTNEQLVVAAGLPDGSFDLFELSSGKTFDALRNGVIDISCNGFAKGGSQFMELAASKDMALVPINDAEFENARELLFGGVVRDTIPAGTYNGIDYDVPTFSQMISVLSSSKVDDEVVYELVKAMWENIEEVQSNPIFNGLEATPVFAYGPTSLPVHEGAAQYYHEIGLERP